MKTSSDQMQNPPDKFLKESGIGYSLAAVLPLFVMFLVGSVYASVVGDGYEVTQVYKYLAYLVPQLCFAVAVFIWFKRTKQPFRQACRGCKWYYFPIAILLQFGLLFSLNYVNEWFIRFLELFGYTQSESALPDLTGWNLLPAVIVIALLPALFEEMIFRGIISRSMHGAGWGTAATVLVCGALFSLFHANPEQTLYQFACGMCFTLVALRSGSVLPTMIAHFLNNAVILALTSFGYGSEWVFPPAADIAIYICSAVCLAGTLVFLIFFDRNNGQKGGAKQGKTFFLAAAVGILVCAIEWIYILILGFIGG